MLLDTLLFIACIGTLFYGILTIKQCGVKRQKYIQNKEQQRLENIIIQQEKVITEKDKVIEQLLKLQ